MAVIPKKDKNRYKKIFHNLNIPMVIIDSNTGNIGEVNIAACQYYGYSEKELLSMNVIDINVSNKEKIFKRIKQTKISDKIYTRSKHRLSTGEVRDVEVYSNFLEIGDEKLVTSIIHDVNEKIKLEKDYLRDKAHFDILFKNSNEAIAIVDNKFRVLETNESFKKMFQYSLSEIKNKDLTEKLCKTELYDDSYNFRESVANGKFVSEELKRYRKDGSELDVLVMGFPLESDGVVSGAYCIYSDISESKNQQDMIKTLSYKDTLTGLFNRDFFLKNLRNEILKKDDNEKNKDRLALILLNINEFKEVNDALGHLIADLLIKEFAVKLKSIVKNEYTIGRVTKNQIAILIPNLRNINEISILTTTIIESLDSSFFIEMNELHVTTNIGVSLYPDDGNDFITLVRKAEIAMDKSKENNKNRVAQFEKVYDREIQENYWIKNDLLKAVESGELFLNYQPIYDINKNKLVGVESLVRWNHKEKGVIPPLKFIPLAEKTELIDSIGEWVLREAFMQSKKWQDLGYKPICMSVNISVKQLENPNFVDLIKKIIKDTEVDPKYIQLEITETVFTNDYELIKLAIKEISSLGIKFSIDDFGTGYSSLKQLCELSINNIKIDKMFIDNVVENPSKSKIVKAIISLAESLEISLTAEGVETEEQLNFLKMNNCPTVQGYLFSKPLHPWKIEKLFLK